MESRFAYEPGQIFSNFENSTGDIFQENAPDPNKKVKYFEPPKNSKNDPFGLSNAAQPSSFSLDQNIIIRFLENECAEALRSFLRNEENFVQSNADNKNSSLANDDSSSQVSNVDMSKFLMVKLDEDFRNGTVQLKGFPPMPARLLDLPNIIELQKTQNGYLFHKSGNVSQILICSSNKDLLDKIGDSNFQYAHGLSPPFYNAHKRVFRKYVQKSNESYYIDSEVKQLLTNDRHALSYEWEVVRNDEVVPDEDSSEKNYNILKQGDIDSYSNIPPDENSKAFYTDSDMDSSTMIKGHHGALGSEYDEYSHQENNDLIGDISSSSEDYEEDFEEESSENFG